MNEKQLKKELTEALDSNIHVTKAGEGSYELEIYAAYDDGLSEDQVQEIVDSGDPRQKFWEILDSAYGDAESYYRNETWKDVLAEMNRLDTHPEGLNSEEESFVREEFNSSVYTLLPEEHFLVQKVKVNLLVDTGDGNYDFTLNGWYPAFTGTKDETVSQKSSLLWLLQQQGYEIADYREVLEHRQGTESFLGSLVQELLEVVSDINQLTFLASISLEDLIRLAEYTKMQTNRYDKSCNPDCGMITIAKDAMCGLFDPITGGGSLLELKLEKDVEMPIKYLAVEADGAKVKHGYDIGSTYGLIGSCWRDVIKTITGPGKQMEVA